ncbi:unnamed protein product [Euphydryas editha]|uniref:Peptidase S1 domain-containing protein n=1 Tax=Euphydryas editha TaxID=104508 RepID=A0AAU9UP70_EUPED|nr:unnamed protein product [Euphydryas editha]
MHYQFHDIKFQAAVGCHIENRKDDADIAWVGGGSLISDKIILTAAHVLWSPDYGRIRYALLGTLNKKDNTGLLLNVINTLQHKLYNRKLNNKMYDIALLTLHERVKFNEFVRPICLPVSDRKINSELIIAGWGEINNKAESSEKLLTGNIMENNVSCSNRLKNNFDPKTMICAQGVYERKDSCKGDSGGPLMAIMTNLCCSYSIEGIVSFGQGRCGDNPVGVYTRVTAYLDWIVQNAWPDEWKKFNKKI